MPVISVRIDKQIENDLNFVMDKRKSTDKSSMIRRMLQKSLELEIINILCSEVKERRISAWKAAELANISLRKMLDELASREIYTYDIEAFEQDLEFLREKHGCNN